MNILITGAASGLGKATARKFADNGHRVYGMDISSGDEYKNIIMYKADITKEEELEKVKEDLKTDNVKLDAIINFAGIYDIGSFVEKDVSKMKKLMDINLMGPISVNRIFHELLVDKGRIVVITSEVAPLDPMPFNGIYNVSKTALDCYTQSLRQELNLLGQKVITIRPGAFNTNLANHSLEATKKLVDETNLYKRNSKKFLKLVQMFMGTPKDPKILANLVYKVTLKKHPKYIYKKHFNIGLVLLNILPKRMQCWIIKTLLK